MNDPAVLFYTSDFLTGVMDMTFEERGQYITLLCYQHQKGHIKEETIRLLVGNCSDNVMKHFIQDDKGLYYNNRMDIEKEKRNNFTNSRRENGKLGGRPKGKSNEPSGKPSGYPTHNPMGNDNDNDNKNIDREYIINYYMLKINNLITGTEYQILDPYIEKFNGNLDIIEYAIDLCVIHKAFNIKYLSRILDNYIKCEYKTLADVKEKEKENTEKPITYDNLPTYPVELEEEYDWLNE